MGGAVLAVIFASPVFAYWTWITRRHLSATSESLTLVSGRGRSESVSWSDIKRIAVTRGDKRPEWSFSWPVFQHVRVQMRDPWAAQPQWEVFAYSDADFERLAQFVSAAADGHKVEVSICSSQ